MSTIKNYQARPGSTLTLDDRGERSTVDLYSRAGLDMLSNLWVKVAAEHRVMYEPTWLGRPIIQFANDIVAIQELLWQVQPDAVIKTGVAHGGSLVLSASVLELIGKGKVIGIDIEIRPHNRAALEAHPLKPRIELIEGSSIAPETLAAVRRLTAGAGVVLAIFDSNHAQAHVRRELELYAPLITPGSYLVAHDGAQDWVTDIPSAKPAWKDGGPLEAIHEFLAAHKEFRIDPFYTRLGITSSPDGYLKRLTEAEIEGR
jgi:cephalosporin hydroxylase